jgi:hypothetical protein
MSSPVLVLMMIAVIIVLFSLVILMPGNVKRTTAYMKDENGNINPITRPVIRGKKIHSK